MNRMVSGFTRSTFRLSWERIVRAYALAWAALVFSGVFSTCALASEKVPWQTLASDAEDAPLRSCFAISPNHLWAVGDRGLVMRSVDGGQSWVKAPIGPNVDYRQIAFANSKVGYLVGGFIWPTTGRSDGCLMKTSDSGETWESVPIMSLSRLSGIQLFSKDNFYVWGDWSAEQRGALLESQDGGMTFSRKELPCAQIAAAAWLNPNQGVVVDRLSRVFVTKNGDDYRQVELPASPLSPIRAAGTDGKTVWLSGENAQLYKSTDLLTWEKIGLNALVDSGVSISLTSVHVATKGDVWITTNLPGIVLSSAEGKSFHVHQTACQTQLYDVCCISTDHVISVGAMNNIVETRNAGGDWQTKYQCGNKLGMLVIAPRLQDIALDALVQSSLGEKQHTGALVIHSQDAISKADVWPDAEQRFQQISSVTVCSWAQILAQFPVGSLSGHSNRKSDLFGYNCVGTAPSAVERELVFAIRALRPDVVVVATSEQKSQLSARATSAAYHAIQLAADPRFRLLSGDATGELPSWRVQRTLSRTPKTTANGLADWSIEPTEVLGNTGQTVGDRVRVASCLLMSPHDVTNLFSDENSNLKPAIHESIYWNSLRWYGNYLNRSSGNRSKGQLASCYSDLLQNESSKRQVSDTQVRNLQTLLATMNLNKALNTLVTMDLSSEAQRSKWLQHLQGFIETLMPDDRARFCLELGLIYQQRGNASQWAMCEEIVMAEPTATIWKETSVALATQFSASAEYRHVFGPLIRFTGRSIANKVESASAVQPAAFVSPFELNNSGVQGSKVSRSVLAKKGDGRDTQGMGSVFDASYTEQKFELQIPVNTEAKSSGQFEPSGALSTSTDNSGAIELMQAAKKNAGPYQFDPRTVLSRISFETRSGQVDEKLMGSLKSLVKYNAVLGWSELVNAELGIQNKTSQPPNRPAATSPPLLDGTLDDELWQSSVALKMSSPWQDDIAGDSMLRVHNDDRFLYLAVRCPKSSPRGPGMNDESVNNRIAKKPASESKARDVIMDESDHVLVRIDIDRDYQTYYEFGISENRDRSDSLNHFHSWNPKWYVEQAESNEGWTAEVAIPLEELMNLEDMPPVIAMNARRQIPGVGIQSFGGIPTDCWIAQTFKLVPLATTNKP